MYKTKEDALRRAAQISTPEKKWVPFEIEEGMTEEYGGRYNENDVGMWDLEREIN